ncbi:MAG: ABC transporter ATP-binding protein [Methylobacteriaceae bacterium]|nr:ABC transporter ATP-binding protein [Methylobacteriaceae bacterium]
MSEDAAPAMLTVRDLHVRFAVHDGEVEAVRGVDIDVARGETVAIVGESGSGKSQAMMAAIGLLAQNGRAAGSVKLDGEELVGRSQGELNRVRGRKVTMIFQEPMTSLDPLFPIGAQLAEPLRHHGRLGRKAARQRSLELLRLVGIPEPERRLASYPHELSGGQRQRVMIAMAIANDPELLVADEPTTALDVTVQAQILELLAVLQRRFGMAIVFITHDLGIVRRFATRVYVMRGGKVVETGATASLFAAPEHAYTKMLIDAEPRGRKAAVPTGEPIVLDAADVRVTYRLPGGVFRSHHEIAAVDGVSLRLQRGQTLGVVGESGSGKSTLGRALLKLVPASGLVRFEDRALGPLDRAAMRPLRRSMQLVFQDPFGSLSPRMTIGEIVGEGLRVHEPHIDRRSREDRAAEALREVGLDPAARNRFPHEFSGGQRQRIAIARVLILKPRLVVLDEPTSALDRSVQRDIVALLRRLQQEHALTYVFISHDLAVVRAMADEILVMRDGKAIESGPAEAIFERPRDEYTRGLIAAAYLSQQT